MTQSSPEVNAARHVTAQAVQLLAQTPTFGELDLHTQSTLTQDLERIQRALNASPQAYASHGDHPDDPYALSLAGPAELTQRRLAAARQGQQPDGQVQASNRRPRAAATETLAGRAGALSDEIDFPGFVASLIHGTFGALVDSSIRQMEEYANLVSAVAKDVDSFTSENVTTNQVRDWLAERHPADMEVQFPNGQPRLRVRGGDDGDFQSPSWLDDYGLSGEELTDELLEESIIPIARSRMGEQRLQMLATMVLMGMNRIVVQDGSVSAKIRFRAAARDRARVDYAQSSDPGGVGTSWGSRGSVNQAAMMVSTVEANVQTEAQLNAQLFGEVRINFASETLPLEQFADAAQMLLLQRNARQSPTQQPSTPLPPPEQAPPDEPPTVPPPVQA